MSHLTDSGDLGFATGPGVWHLEPLLYFITEKSPMGSSYHQEAHPAPKNCLPPRPRQPGEPGYQTCSVLLG